MEYGVDSIEIHADAAGKGSRVLLIDDLLATGETAQAAYKLLTKIGSSVVGIGFVIELAFGGRAKLPSELDVFKLLTYK